MFLKWKEDEDDDSRFKLDKYLLKLCNKRRLIELLHDFVLFDGGVKKLPRVHQLYSDNCLSPPTDNYLSPVNG